ncbi:MAG: 16S rRNA (guanine(527)-N(7))-methyltransferase RsmG [Bacteroidota bacterium]|nr:16S rRNA (guanine(527)-N(7))-methyltransferase RsmG [Bacteroidota bacterium]
MELIARWFADFSPEQWRQLAAVEGVYREWNEKINVISRKDIGSLYEKHVLHSLAIAAAFELPDGMEVIDIGTGGGFPGIPLAIYFPNVQFHLVDSIGKKLKVVEAVRDATGLKNVSTQHIRAEEIRGRKFDLAVSRAVAPLKDLWNWSRPLLKKAPRATAATAAGATPPAGAAPHGLICLKGGDVSAEIADSGCRPKLMEIREIFPLEWFHEKYLLYVPNP